MNCLVILFCLLITESHHAYHMDQKPDLLLVGSDTIFLKSYPLEDLRFEQRPFSYSIYDFPDDDCIRGYLATWRIVDDSLYLVNVVKGDETHKQLDLVKYFSENDYSPIMSDGMIFADWFTMELSSFPRHYNYLGCNFKSYRVKKSKACLKFDKGIVVYNKY